MYLRMRKPAILSATPSAASSDRTRPSARAQAVVFDACQIGVVLRTVVFVEAVVGVAAMFVSGSPGEWLVQAATVTGGALPATLLWLVAACGLKKPLRRLPVAWQYAVGEVLGAISALYGCGLLPLTQTAMRFLKIGYHDYQGVVLNTAEQASLLEDLGDSEAVIFRNHGALVVGRSVGEAFNWMHRLELACRAQIGAMSCNTPLKAVPQEVLEETWNNYQPGTRRPYGLMEWPALLRKLDRIDDSYKQ